jgi:glycosyltransferase involved in cell wall biosynthesis
VLFSVVITTYKRPAYLTEAVASVLAQTFTDFECIVVDDASPEPPKLTDDPRLRLICRDVNGGAAAARNTGIDSAEGTYVAFLDDDDVWTPNRLADAAEAHARAPIATCFQATLGSTAAPSGRLLEGDVGDRVLDGMIPHLGATSVERTAAPRLDERYDASDDVEWWLRAARQLEVATTPRVGLLYRVHDEPRTRTSQLTRVHDGEMLLEQHAEWFRTHPRAKAFRLKRMGLSALQVDDRRLARAYFARSLRLNPEPRTAWHVLRTFAPQRRAPGA